MKKSSREALDAYYREAGSWAADQIGTLRLSRRVAWIVAAVAAVIAIVEGLALIVLMPLKTTVPYTLMVDRTTGFVQALKPLDPAQITPDRALVQSMLVQYVIAREGFDMGSLQADYGKVGLWSAGTARTEYLALMQASNTSSPLNLYPASTLVETRVKSVSPLNSSSALVRFETIRRDEGGQPHSACLGLRLSSIDSQESPWPRKTRFLNPLGFQVTGYRRDAEALAPAPLPSITQEAAAPANDLPQAAQ